MANEASDCLTMPLDELKELVLNLVAKMGYVVESIHVEDENHFQVIARNESAPIDNDMLLWVRRRKRKLGVHDVKSLLKHMEDSKKSKGVLIAPGGFTDEALALGDGERLVLMSYLDVGASPAAPADAERVIYDRVFESSQSLEEAGRYFEERRRKPLFGFGFLGSEESVESVVGRYTPVGCFEVVRKSFLWASGINVTEGRSVVYVNLNTGGLYYVRKGVLGSPPALKSTNILRRITELPRESAAIMAELVEAQRFSLDRLVESHRLSYGGNMDFLVMLRNRDLVTVSPDGRTVFSNVGIPRFGDGRYGLEKFIGVKESVDSQFQADSIEFRPTDLMPALGGLFTASVVFKGVLYMPYYHCTYVNKLREYRYDMLLTPKFESSG